MPVTDFFVANDSAASRPLEKHNWLTTNDRAYWVDLARIKFAASGVAQGVRRQQLAEPHAVVVSRRQHVILTTRAGAHVKFCRAVPTE
jgi:hypothetical protein